MQSMIFAAGLGTRLKPLTDRMPKALVRVGGKPLLEHTIERLRMAGCKHIVVNVHHFANQIIDFLNANDFGIDIRISDETEQLLDTGGGIKKAARLLIQKVPSSSTMLTFLATLTCMRFMTASRWRKGNRKLMPYYW